tara:strand:+ start:25 stop:216 length:192 start_codon:yes stop_codon:yes gene_type:complete
MLGDHAIIVLQWKERKKQSEEKKEVVPPLVIQGENKDNTLSSPIFSMKGIIDGFWKSVVPETP